VVQDREKRVGVLWIVEIVNIHIREKIREDVDNS
jgi:hypothetical protein